MTHAQRKGVCNGTCNALSACLEQSWRTTERLVEVGTDVVLEIGLIQRAARQVFYDRVDSMGYDMAVYVLEASRELRRERVLRRNQQKGDTFSMEVPLEIFELASDLWQPPKANEGKQRELRFVDE